MLYNYDLMLQPMKINGMRVKNRIILSPMGTFTPMKDNTDSEEGIRYYEERAKGGAGMITTGAMFITTKMAQGSPTIGVDDFRCIPKTTVMVERCHRWGAKVCLQLSAGTGRNGALDVAGGTQLLSASENPTFYDPTQYCRAMTIEEIKGAVEEFKVCTDLALKAGYDAIEIHAHAGYIIDQFMSPIWNKRTDEYGGSLENRCRFAVEIIQAIREIAGPDFPILYRISMDHRFEGGRTLKDSMEILPILEAAGVDAFDVDAGAYETQDYIFPTSYVGEGCMAYVCEYARKVTKKPIINAGNHSMETAAELLASGNADFVQFGRQLIADPEFPNKLKAGHREDVRPCLICNEECIGRIFGRLTQLSCSVNPSVGLEDYMEIQPLEKPKRVAVIGAGPAGLEAARVAAMRGCDVTIYEKENEIGGVYGAIATSTFKKRIRDLITWYKTQLHKLGVEIKLNYDMKADDPVLAGADEIFAGTGSVPFVPPIPGKDLPNVVDVTEAHKHGVNGENIVICGGGLSGADTAIELGGEGRRCTIIEMLPDICNGVFFINKMSVSRYLEKYNVDVKTSAKVAAFEPDGVVIEQDGVRKKIPADTIITAFGQRPNTALTDELEAKYPTKLTVIGDCAGVAKAAKAIREGFYAAMALQ